MNVEVQHSGVCWPLLLYLKFIHTLKVVAAENPEMVILQFLGLSFLDIYKLLFLSPLLVIRPSGDRERRPNPKKILKSRLWITLGWVQSSGGKNVDFFVLRQAEITFRLDPRDSRVLYYSMNIVPERCY